MAAKDINQLDLYDLLEINSDANTDEIRKAYRKKALTCHPDKNKENPNATDLFHQLSKALEILTDTAARAAYDKILKARKAAEIRNRALDSERKKFKDDLEAREKKNRDDVEANFKAEIERLRKESTARVEAEEEYQRQHVRKVNERAEFENVLPSLSVKWRKGVKYTNEDLHEIFSAYGPISCVSVLNSVKRKAIVEYLDISSAEKAVKCKTRFTLKWLQGRSIPKTTEWSNSEFARPPVTSIDLDYEQATLMKLREFQKRKLLIE